MMKKMLLPVLALGMMVSFTANAMEEKKKEENKEIKKIEKIDEKKIEQPLLKNEIIKKEENNIPVNNNLIPIQQPIQQQQNLININENVNENKEEDEEKKEINPVNNNLNPIQQQQNLINENDDANEITTTDKPSCIANLIPTKGFLIGTGAGAGLSLAAIIVALECNFGHKIAAKFESMTAEELATLPFFKKALSKLGFSWKWLEEKLAVRYSNKKVLNIAVKLAIVIVVAITVGFVGRGIQINGFKKALCPCCCKETVNLKDAVNKVNDQKLIDQK